MLNKLRILFTQIYIRLFGKCTGISDRTYNRVLHFLRTGKRANLDNPKTFAEHVLALKVTQDESDYSRYTDKYAVREYVGETIGKAFLVKNLGVWKNPEDIPFETLPQKFVLKATHGSGWNIVVADKEKLNIPAAVNKLKGFLKENYYFRSRERNYKNIPPRVVAEEFIENKPGMSIADFKVFCFHGTPRFYSVSYEKDGVLYTGTFDLEQGRLPIEDGNQQANAEEFSHQEEQAIALAAQLCAPFPFVRVDFYLTGEQLLFSELTFHSGGGIVPIRPNEINLLLGSYFEA